MARVTIRDIARHAGTSFKTVSRVINSENGVGDELRQKVRASMAELGYRPDRAAQTLRSGRNYAICILSAVAMTNDLNSESPPDFVSLIMTGALRTCREQGYQLSLGTVPLEQDGNASAEERLLSLRSDGIILYPPHADNIWLLDQLDRLKIPYVRLLPGLQLDRSACFVVDDLAAGRELGELVLAHGHRRIACITGPAAHLAAARRVEGFQLALESAGDVDLSIETGDFYFKSGFDFGMAMLGSNDSPSVIFAANDLMALGVMAAARDLGLDIPRELSIIGFDDIPMTRFIRPSLTTVSQNMRRMGELAAAHLIDAVNKRDEIERQVFKIPYELIIRESLTAPA